MSLIKDYFIQQANIVDCEFSASNVTGHPADTGDNRELFIKKFLNEHLPSRARAFIGGKIFDSKNGRSRQMDIVIYDDFTPKFCHLDKTLYMVDGVYAAMEIKSELTRSVINGSNEKPSMFDFSVSVKNLARIQGEGTIFFENSLTPALLFGLFAYSSSLSPEEIISDISEYYKRNATATARKIDFICVNKKFTIALNSKEQADKTRVGKGAISNDEYIVIEKGDLALWEMFQIILKHMARWVCRVPNYSAYMGTDKE